MMHSKPRLVYGIVGLVICAGMERSASADVADLRQVPQVEQAAAHAEAATANLHPSRLFVEFKNETPRTEIDEALKRAGVTSTVATFSLVPGLLAVEVPAGGVQAAIRTLSAEPSVKYAEPVLYRRALSQQTPYGITMVNAPAVWSMGGANSRGQGVRVAVLDTGGSSHPDLPFPELFESFISGENWSDIVGHGTHCAGIICAVDNTQGVVGVAPAINLLVGKVLDNLGAGDVGILSGLNWAVTNGAKVISMSLGGEGGSQAEQAIYTAAFNAGSLVVAAAGNEGPTGPTNYPAAYQNVLAVQAVDSAGVVASFGQVGSHIAISAPGVDVNSTITISGPTVFWNGAQNSAVGQWTIGSPDTFAFGTIVYCGTGRTAAEYPPAVNGNIALIRSAATAPAPVVSFRTEALAARAAGARCLVIADNAGASTLSLLGMVTAQPYDPRFPIPVFTISQASGDALQAAAPVQGQTTSSNINGFGYELDSGTSMATPHVAGVAALLFSKYASRNPTPAQVRQALLESATDLGVPGMDTTYGAGLVNASAAITRLGQILCRADFNGVNGINGVNLQDIFDFLNAWFASLPSADINNANGVTLQDIFDFLNAWFTGC